MKTMIRTESLDVIKALKDEEVNFIFVEPFFSYHHPHTLSLESFKALVDAVGETPWYLEINAYIEDHQLSALNDLLKAFHVFSPKGIYFNDFAVYQLLKEMDYHGEIIYAPETILTNSNDVEFYLNYVDRCVLARELTLDEILHICSKFSDRVEVFGLGYATMSVSKRPLVQNYMDEIKRDDEVLNRLDFKIQEEKRPEWMPILEEINATSTYMPSITFSKDQINDFKEANCASLLCDSLFINDEDFIELYKHMMNLKTKLSLEDLSIRNPLGEGYYYRKTNLLKGETA